ncbi:class I SAM-dependent methyltransferase [Kibdelosporangium phytohabitans]|uniref:Methyltransferase type 11 n=1 Tax=Kibdelosporangium phytohabitans TaxID=860235 RepID=A0A0N9IF57_9PSEU|nr:methyltransferase domain-containing protein [Kibdelosporangium phytohabitans]ALG13426.1 methyltransferase type 11 [Kibdelosporangium phytohabitans]MBE1465232.1 SAM-dependent methyltransferase [Kibdelosporangium phytohabitans]
MPTYTHGHHEAVLRSHRTRTVANSAAYLLPHLTTGMSLLDVGCGPGTITADLAGLVGRVTAIEPSSEALALARDFVKQPNVRFDVADVHALPYADNTFDVVHAHQVLQHVHDPVAALKEMRRVSKGTVAARDSDYAGFVWYPEVPALDEWLTLYRKVARHNGGEPDAGRRLLSWARAAGFEEVVGSGSVWCYATAEEREWWGGMWADRIVQTQIAEHAISYGYATRADLERISDGWREWVAAPDGWFAILHGEILCRG